MSAHLIVACHTVGDIHAARNENAQLYLAPPPLSPSTPNKALASPNKALATEHVLIESLPAASF